MRLRGNLRITESFRFRGGIVYRRTVVQVKTRTVVRSKDTVLPIRVTAADDQGVDRVSIQVDGRTAGVDWSAGDGWSVDVPCTAGSHTITALAYDAANNEGVTRVDRRIAC